MTQTAQALSELFSQYIRKQAAARAPAALRANEEAALLWHRGRYEDAAKMWQTQEDSTAVLFNRGMAALFLGRAADAVTPLTEATRRLPETDAWHHLGRLYLAL